MAIFTALEPADGNPDRMVLVKDGFSVAAAVLTVLWALWHRMWIVAALLLAMLGALALAAAQLGLGEPVVALMESAIFVIFGFEAQALRLASLTRSGYRTAGLIEASNHETAELKYFLGRRQESRPVTGSSRVRGDAADTLGLFGSH